jgi:hypothetical protein
MSKILSIYLGDFHHGTALTDTCEGAYGPMSEGKANWVQPSWCQERTTSVTLVK